MPQATGPEVKKHFFLRRLTILNSLSQNGDVAPLSESRKQELAELEGKLAKLKTEYSDQPDKRMKDVILRQIDSIQEAIDCIQKGKLQHENTVLKQKYTVLKEKRTKLEEQLSMARSNYLAEPDELMKKEYAEEMVRIKEEMALNNQDRKQNSEDRRQNLEARKQYYKEQILASQERIRIFHEMKEDDQKEREVDRIPFLEDDSEPCKKLVDADPFSPSFKSGENMSDGLLKELKFYFSKEVSQEHVNECQQKYFNPSYMQNHLKGRGENAEVGDRHSTFIFSSIRVDNNIEEHTTIFENTAKKVVVSRTDIMKTLYETLIEKRSQGGYPDSLIWPKEFTESPDKLNVTFDSLYYQPRFPIDTDECVRVIVDILVALLYLHKLGYVHRDLRRNNILQRKVPNEKFILIDLEHADLVGEIFPYDEVRIEEYRVPVRFRTAYKHRTEKQLPQSDNEWQKLDDIAQFGDYIHEAGLEMKKEEDMKNASLFAECLKKMSQDEYKDLEVMSEGENVSKTLEGHMKSKLKKHIEAPTGE